MTGRASVIHVSTGRPLRARAIWQAVKHSPCTRCSGAWWDRSQQKQIPQAPAYLCECPEGWTGTETPLGMLADSGPRGWRRPFWLLGQQIAAGVAAFKRRFA